MSTRKHPEASLGVRASPSRLTANMTWEQMAAFHSSGRNNAVVLALVNAVAVKQMRAFASLSLSAALLPDAQTFQDDASDDVTSVDAALQLPGGKKAEWTVPVRWQSRLDELQASKDVRDKFERKATRSVEAHCIPCTVAVNGMRLNGIIEQALIKAGSNRLLDGTRAARAPFAQIDPLPLAFNESDSHAERTGLKRALLTACQSIAYGMSSPSRRHILDRVHNGYEKWKSGAIAALDTTIANNQEKLVEAQSTKDAFEIIKREARISILEGYRADTASVPPSELTPAMIDFYYTQVSDIVR